jgi:hypothetical protein
VDSDKREDNKWHLDKRVPLALIFAIVVQTIVVVSWLASLGERVNGLERTRDATAPQSDRLTRVEVKIEGIQATTERIERLIRREPSN